jgi:hypothetical protein
MDDKITIIEGPPPVFEPAQDGWARNWQRLPEAADLYQMAVVKEVYN